MRRKLFLREALVPKWSHEYAGQEMSLYRIFRIFFFFFTFVFDVTGRQPTLSRLATEYGVLKLQAVAEKVIVGDIPALGRLKHSLTTESQDDILMTGGAKSNNT